MSGILNSLFDPYDRKARVAPALMCGLPLFVSFVLLVPEVGTMWAAVGGLVLYCGGATMLAQVGRDRGRSWNRGCMSRGAESLLWPCCVIATAGSPH